LERGFWVERSEKRFFVENREGMLKKIYLWPARHLTVVIPLVMALGFAAGLNGDTGFLKRYLFIGTFFMIFPSMIGFRLGEAVSLSYLKVVLISLALNFLVVPLVGLGTGLGLLVERPALLAGLALISIIPTSGMTISWTMINKGNVPAALKISVLGLLTGALVAPWYLLWMVGRYVSVDTWTIFRTIGLVVFLPMLAGTMTYLVILRRYTEQEFKKRIKPLLPAASVWVMLFVIFSSMSMKAKAILAESEMIWVAALALIAFYLTVFTLSTVVGRIWLDRSESVTLVYGTAMRNLSIALGVAAAAFGPAAALIVTLAFVLQVQGAAWYGRLLQEGKIDAAFSSLLPRREF